MKRYCVIDLETFPSEGYFYNKLWETNIIKVLKPEFLLCFAYKWEGEPTRVLGLDDMPGYKKGDTDDRKLVKKLWEIFNEAPIIVGQNSDQFDIKWANTRFIMQGLKPPSSYKTYDTLKINKKYFKFPSNKLDFVSKQLMETGKVEHEGFPLWERCKLGCPKAWKKMKKYNKKDVDLTDALLQKQLPWVKNKPVVWEGRECPRCQSHHTQRRGETVNLSGHFQRFSCQECGHFFQGNQIIKKL